MSDSNLFSPEYTQGNLAEIDFIAGIIGRIVVIVLSIVGFGIIMATLLKNALHGLYATSPKFWDRVDEAKKATLGLSSAQGGNQISKVIGSVTIVALNCLPNIKALTDFDDEVLDAKAYFMKAIPLACVQIFIGAFVFFGYPAKVAEKFSDFGTGMFDVVLMNVDPLAWVQAIPKKMVLLDLATDGSKNAEDEVINKVTRAVYKTYVGELKDMTAEKRTEVSRLIEEWITAQAGSDYAIYCDNDKYKATVKARITVSAPNLDRVHMKGEDIKTFAYATPLDTWEHGSTLSAANKYIRYDLMFTPIASKGNTKSVECDMFVQKSKATANKTKNEIVITLDAAGSNYNMSALNGKANGTVTVSNKTVKVNISVTNGNVLTITPQTSGTVITTATSVTGIGGLYYNYDEGRHAVRSLSFDKASVTNMFVPQSKEDGISNWSWGATPVDSGETSDTKKTTTTTTDSSGALGN